MANTPQGLADGTLAVGSNTVFTATAATVITSFIVTNTDANIKALDVYVNRGTSRLLDSKKIPGGIGVAVSMSSALNLTLNSGDIVTVTADKTGVNYDLSGWVIS